MNDDENTNMKQRTIKMYEQLEEKLSWSDSNKKILWLRSENITLLRNVYER